MLGWISSANDHTDRSNCQRTSVLCGYLWKMKRNKKLMVPQWNKRFFSIEGKYLRWYKSHSDEHWSGFINLLTVTNIQQFEQQGSYSFIINCPDRNLLLRANSSQELSKWVRVLQMQTDNAKGGNGTSIVANGSNGTGTGRHKSKTSTWESALEKNLHDLERLEHQILEQGPIPEISKSEPFVIEGKSSSVDLSSSSSAKYNSRSSSASRQREVNLDDSYDYDYDDDAHRAPKLRVKNGNGVAKVSNNNDGNTNSSSNNSRSVSNNNNNNNNNKSMNNAYNDVGRSAMTNNNSISSSANNNNSSSHYNIRPPKFSDSEYDDDESNYSANNSSRKSSKKISEVEVITDLPSPPHRSGVRAWGSP